MLKNIGRSPLSSAYQRSVLKMLDWFLEPTHGFHDMITRIRVLYDEAFERTLKSLSHTNNEINAWVRFLLKISNFPNLHQFELYVALPHPCRYPKPPQRPLPAYVRASTLDYSRISPLVLPIVSHVPQLKSIGLWRSRAGQTEFKAKGLYRKEERMLLVILGEKAMSFTVEQSIFRQLDLIRARAIKVTPRARRARRDDRSIRDRRPWAQLSVFDTVPSLDSRKWRLDDSGRFIRVQRRRRRHFRAVP